MKKNRSAITVDELFFKLGLLYSHAWSNQLKNPAWVAGLKAEWQATLSQLSTADVQRVFACLRSPDNTRYLDFPPNPLQFLHLARTQRHQAINGIRLSR